MNNNSEKMVRIGLPSIYNYKKLHAFKRQLDNSEAILDDHIGYSITSMVVKYIVSLAYGKTVDDYFPNNQYVIFTNGYANYHITYPDEDVKYLDNGNVELSKLKQYDELMYQISKSGEIKEVFPKRIRNNYDINNINNELIEHFVRGYKLIKNIDDSQAQISEKSLEDTKTLINRTLNYLAGKNVKMLTNEFYITDNELIHIVISIKDHKMADTFDKFEDQEIEVKELENPNINKVIVYNPRFNSEIVFDGEDNKQYNELLIKQQLIEKKAKDEKLFNKLKVLKPNEVVDLINDMYKEALSYDKSIKLDSMIKTLDNLMYIYEYSLKEAFDLYIMDLGYGIKHTSHEIRFDGELYLSKLELYKKLFKKNAKKAERDIINNMKLYKLDWETALRIYMKYPSKKRGKEVIYKRKKYKTKKEILTKLFPDREYESVSSSINSLMKNYDLSFEKAVDSILNSDNSREYRISITYNGKTYKSIREACLELGIKPHDVSYYAKKLHGDYNKAIEFCVNTKQK